jgi:hypothetical protein
MPKTKTEARTERKFEKEYGSPKKGKQVYFALRNKNKKFDRSQGGGMSSGKKTAKKASWWVERLAKLPEPRHVIQVMKALSWDASEIEKSEHEGHLVTDEDGNKHLPTHTNGKPNHRLMGAAWAALHGGYRGNKYEGPDKQQAISKLKNMYRKQGMKPPSEK